MVAIINFQTLGEMSAMEQLQALCDLETQHKTADYEEAVMFLYASSVHDEVRALLAGAVDEFIDKKLLSLSTKIGDAGDLQFWSNTLNHSAFGGDVVKSRPDVTQGLALEFNTCNIHGTRIAVPMEVVDLLKQNGLIKSHEQNNFGANLTVKGMAVYQRIAEKLVNVSFDMGMARGMGM